MKIEASSIMQGVRDEMTRRIAVTDEGSDADAASTCSVLPFWQGSAPEFVAKPEYSLDDLLSQSDEGFVQTAYQAVLRRAPEPEGLESYLGRLRSGSMTKIELLAALRWSPEGEAKGVHVDGLLAPYLIQKWQRIRFLGPVIGWLHSLARLPALSRRIGMLDAVHAREEHELGRFVNEVSRRIEERINVLGNRIASERRQRSETFQSYVGEAESSKHAIEHTMLDLDHKLSDVHRRLSDIDQKLSILENNASQTTRRLDELEERSQSQSTAVAENQDAVAARISSLETDLLQIEQRRLAQNTSDQSLDALYVAFEEQFRGPRDLIRRRVLPYIAVLQDAQVGTPQTPVVDIGCGRGDWLDVLREHNLVASGIDSNHIFVELCRGRGLTVEKGDALQMLRQLPDGSVGAVTGLHIAEHLPFETLVSLIDECRRVICMGGVLILETPNPENPQVATLFFYMDPTHRNPLPPDALRWLIEARGFQRVRIERLTTARDMGPPPLLDAATPGAESVNVLLGQLHAALDYAIVARRL